MLVLFGERPQAVVQRKPVVRTTYRGRRRCDLRSLTLEFPGGRLGQLTIDRLSRGGDRYAEVRADCEQPRCAPPGAGARLLELGKKRARPRGAPAAAGPRRNRLGGAWPAPSHPGARPAAPRSLRAPSGCFGG